MIGSHCGKSGSNSRHSSLTCSLAAARWACESSQLPSKMWHRGSVACRIPCANSRILRSPAQHFRRALIKPRGDLIDAVHTVRLCRRTHPDLTELTEQQPPLLRFSMKTPREPPRRGCGVSIFLSVASGPEFPARPPRYVDGRNFDSTSGTAGRAIWAHCSRRDTRHQAA